MLLLRALICIFLLGLPAATARAQHPDYCATLEKTRQAGLHDIESHCVAAKVDHHRCYNAARTFVRMHETFMRSKDAANCANLDRVALRAELARARRIGRGMIALADGSRDRLAAEHLVTDHLRRLVYNYFRTSVCDYIFASRMLSMAASEPWSIHFNSKPFEVGGVRQKISGPASDPKACGVVTLKMAAPDTKNERSALGELRAKIADAWERAEEKIGLAGASFSQIALGGPSDFQGQTTSEVDQVAEELLAKMSDLVRVSGLGWQALVPKAYPPVLLLPDATGPDVQTLKEYPDVAKAYADFSNWLDGSIPDHMGGGL